MAACGKKFFDPLDRLEWLYVEAIKDISKLDPCKKTDRLKVASEILYGSESIIIGRIAAGVPVKLYEKGQST